MADSNALVCQSCIHLVDIGFLFDCFFVFFLFGFWVFFGGKRSEGTSLNTVLVFVYA